MLPLAHLPPLKVCFSIQSSSLLSGIYRHRQVRHAWATVSVLLALTVYIFVAAVFRNVTRVYQAWLGGYSSISSCKSGRLNTCSCQSVCGHVAYSVLFKIAWCGNLMSETWRAYLAGSVSTCVFLMSGVKRPPLYWIGLNSIECIYPAYCLKCIRKVAFFNANTAHGRKKNKHTHEPSRHILAHTRT